MCKSLQLFYVKRCALRSWRNRNLCEIPSNCLKTHLRLSEQILHSIDSATTKVRSVRKRNIAERKSTRHLLSKHLMRKTLLIERDLGGYGDFVRIHDVQHIKWKPAYAWGVYIISIIWVFCTNFGTGEDGINYGGKWKYMKRQGRHSWKRIHISLEMFFRMPCKEV